jgi:hypothetical protein
MVIFSESQTSKLLTLFQVRQAGAEMWELSSEERMLRVSDLEARLTHIRGYGDDKDE